MPYSEGAKLTVTNDSDEDSFLYFYVDYQEWEKSSDDLGRFHANWRRELVTRKDVPIGPNAVGEHERLNTTGDENYVVLEVEGKGHYVGCCLHLDTNEPGWWGEGDDMFFIDGEPWPPRLHGLAPRTTSAEPGITTICRSRIQPHTTATISRAMLITPASTLSTVFISKTRFTSTARCGFRLSMVIPTISRETGRAQRTGIK